MEDVRIFYGHAVYFTAMRHIFWSFGIFCGNLVSFPRFGILFQEKSGNPVSDRQIDIWENDSWRRCLTSF
jgi:hypothetical protein